MRRVMGIAAGVLCLAAGAQAPAGALLGRVFATGWMLQDTNHDGLAESVRGHIVVPAEPTAAENAAAANLAARLTHGTMGLTPPLVVMANSPEAAGPGPHIYIDAASVPQARAGEAKTWTFRLAAGQGRVVELSPGQADSDLLVLGDDKGLTAAAADFAARADFQWSPGTKAKPGDRLEAIAAAVNAAVPGAHAALVGLDYAAGEDHIAKAYLTAGGPVTSDGLAKAFASGHLAGVKELFVLGGSAVSAMNPKLAAAKKPAAPVAAAKPAAGAGGGAANSDAADDAPASGASLSGLDLGNLFAAKDSLLGSDKMLVPSSSKSHLYVPAGAPGVAMANLAARMGLESTGITLPIATPVEDANLKKITEQAVVAGDNPVAAAVAKKLGEEDTVAAPALAPGEGALRVVDRAFGKNSALLIRGDAAGAAAAADLAADHLPNVWRPGKQYDTIEGIRYDLHRFFSLHSGVGQAAAGLFFLDRWADRIAARGGAVHDVKAELYADLVDPKMGEFLRRDLAAKLHAEPAVEASSLRAGTQCCEANPDLHYDNPEFPFHQGTPVFTEDVKIPWEGTTLLDDVRAAVPKLNPNQAVSLEARVSEGPAERQKLAAQVRDILTRAGIPAGSQHVEVLDAFKQGYSWLTDEVAPALEALKKEGKPAARLDIEFAKDVDETGVRDMYSPARWVQELYPVDEVLAKRLDLPLGDIALHEINTAPPVETAAQIAMADPPNDPPSPTYRVHAYDAAGHEILVRDFTVKTVMQPYSGVLPAYEDVQVETGWLTLAQAGRPVVDRRIETDIEQFWHHYQTVTLPRVYRFVMAQSGGHLRTEYAPPFDTLQMDFHLSEPDYNIGIDKERISSIEALQEDVFYSTETFIDAMADLKTGKPEDYVGRIIPVMHPSEDGRDGLVHIAFYGKAAANPLVRLSWTDAAGQSHTETRNLPVLTGAFQPRLIAARVRAGQPGIENLTWLLPADGEKYDMAQWQKVEGREQLERSMFTVEQAAGMVRELDAMHAAGLYPDELAYQEVGGQGGGQDAGMTLELQLPRPLATPYTKPEKRVAVAWHVGPPMHDRPQIADIAPIALPADGSPFVQWREPIGPEESAAILSRLSKYPGVNVYSMGRTYLGQVIWAADIMEPTPATLISWAKETTLKASLVYSARQHANEVSSTSHVLRLAEMLVSDPAYKALLKQVNVVVHPIDNPDGAKLSVIEAKIVPDNLLHLGYHGALAADVSSGQGQVDPVYPESRTRAQLLAQWNPDGFLNPHGYPSHEWVQPFSEYSAWVQSRDGANNGRTWWIPRGWFTSLNYSRDNDGGDSYSKDVTFSLRDRIAAAERKVPGLLPLENRMNARYQRWGQAFQPDNMQQPLVDGIRIYMSLKGQLGPGRGGMAGPGATAAVTWDQGYTEAPDETAHGDYMKLVASAGLAYDLVHLDYMAQGKLRIERTEKASPQGVTWSVERKRPILPASEPAVAKPPDGQ